MAKSRPTDVFDEFEGTADRLAAWIRENALIVGGGIALILGAVWGAQAWLDAGSEAEDEASAQLARVRGDFLVAMGASPGSYEVPELANPEAGKAIRSEYAAKMNEVADAHPGTVAGTLARLQALEIAEAEPDATVEALEVELAGLSAQDSLRAIVLQRLAQAQESAGRLAEAAAAYEQAGSIDSYPLRLYALADAARCYAAAGQTEEALRAYDALDQADPDLALPDLHEGLRQSLRAAAQS